MAKQTSAYTYEPSDSKVSRPNVHAKTKTSNHKNSKNYRKIYKGQGR
jgi:hypothetical protein